MEREIKFRGLNTINGNWVYGYYYVDQGRHVIHSGHTIYPVHPFSVGQFTGLKDKNGKEIYESDIFQVVYETALGDKISRNGSVVFKFGRWMLKHIHPLTEDLAFGDLHSLLKENNRKVIGNIHQNPELI